MAESGAPRRRIVCVRFLGEHEEVVEDLLSKRIILEKSPGFIGNDELIGLFAISDGKSVLFIVFDQPDDFKLVFLSIGRLDDDRIVQFNFPFALGFTIRKVDDRPPGAGLFVTSSAACRSCMRELNRCVWRRMINLPLD